MAQSLSFMHAPPALDDALEVVEVDALEAVEVDALDDALDEALVAVVLPTDAVAPRAPPRPDEVLEADARSTVDGRPPAPPVLDESDGPRSMKSPSTCAQDSVMLGARNESARAKRA
jgi:hypothetical protein